MALIEQRLHDDAHRIGEIDHPGVLRATARRFLGELENHRDGAERFGETPRTGCLLTDASELERQSLIHQSGSLAADAQLDDHKVRAIEGSVAISSQDQVPGPLSLCENAPGEPTYDFEAFGVDVVQDQLIDGQALATSQKSLDELRRVGAAAADDRYLHAHVGASYAKMDGNG